MSSVCASFDSALIIAQAARGGKVLYTKFVYLYTGEKQKWIISMRKSKKIKIENFLKCP